MACSGVVTGELNPHTLLPFTTDIAPSNDGNEKVDTKTPMVKSNGRELQHDVDTKENMTNKSDKNLWRFGFYKKENPVITSPCCTVQQTHSPKLNNVETSCHVPKQTGPVNKEGSFKRLKKKRRRVQPGNSSCLTTDFVPLPIDMLHRLGEIKNYDSPSVKDHCLGEKLISMNDGVRDDTYCRGMYM